MLVNVYSIFHISQSTMKKLSVHELDMVPDSLISVALDLDIEFQVNPGLIDHKPLFPAMSFHNIYI